MKKILIFWACLSILTIKSLAATLALAWDANTDATTGYKLYGITGGATNQLVTVLGIGTTTAVITVSNAVWTFYATAINGTEESLSSNSLLASVLPAPAVIIPAPVVVHTGGGLYSSTFSWTPSAPDYYVTNYIAKLTKPGGIVEIQNKSNTSAVFTGLSDGSYSFTVTPVNFGINGNVAFYNFSIVRLGNPKNFRIRTN